MKNIGIFVFIGLLSVVFQTKGWFPNEDIYAISQVAYRYVLPCMIAYEGGNLLSDSFGGLAAVMALCGILLRDPEAQAEMRKCQEKYGKPYAADAVCEFICGQKEAAEAAQKEA